MPVHERRQYFRIDDHIYFEYKLIEPGQPCSDLVISKELIGKNNQKYLEATQFFQSIDNELTELTKEIGCTEPAIAHYLNLLNSKIDFLSRQMLMTNKTQMRKVTLSLGGMSFKTHELLKTNSHLKIIIYTKPKMIPIIVDGTVLTSEYQSEDNHRTTVVFPQLTLEQEQLLSQHILFAQIKNRAN